MRCFLVLLALVFGMTLCDAGQRGLPATDGILNFGRVDERVFRGAQPDEVAMKNLARLGVKSIINLRTDKKSSQAESSQAQQFGIVYTNIPLSGVGRPSDANVVKILSLIETLPSPVFIHCQHGCDRTGTIVACYRIKSAKWSSDQALKEAKTYGISKAEWRMRHFIVDFAEKAKREGRTHAL